jgi:membrane-associated protease RseP (regulator of RpoE activity)
MSTQVPKSVFGPCAVFAVLLAGTSFAVAQPLRPPAPDQEPQAAPRSEAREPGYLGLIADDRRDQGAGVRVVKVVDGSPAAAAGIEINDLITAIDGQAVGSLASMATQLEPHGALDKVRFEIRRGDTTRTIEVALGRRPPPGERPFEFGRIPERLPDPAASATVAPPRAIPPPAAPSPEAAAGPRGQLLGVRSGPLSEEARVRLGVPQAGGALVVARVVGSPADKAGIPLDAVIVAVDGTSVASPADLARLIEAAGPGREVELAYYSRGERHQATVTLGNVIAPPRPAPDVTPAPNRGDAPMSPEREVAPPASAVQRIEQLERRILALENRLESIEQALRRAQP